MDIALKNKSSPRRKEQSKITAKKRKRITKNAKDLIMVKEIYPRITRISQMQKLIAKERTIQDYREEKKKDNEGGEGFKGKDQKKLSAGTLTAIRIVMFT